MKKFFVAMTLLAALIVTMIPSATTFASIQTVEKVECSWWGKQVNRKPTAEEWRRRQQMEIQRRNREIEQRRRAEAERERQRQKEALRRYHQQQ